MKLTDRYGNEIDVEEILDMTSEMVDLMNECAEAGDPLPEYIKNEILKTFYPLAVDLEAALIYIRNQEQLG